MSETENPKLPPLNEPIEPGDEAESYVVPDLDATQPDNANTQIVPGLDEGTTKQFSAEGQVDRMAKQADQQPLTNEQIRKMAQGQSYRLNNDEASSASDDTQKHNPNS